MRTVELIHIKAINQYVSQNSWMASYAQQKVVTKSSLC